MKTLALLIAIVGQTQWFTPPPTGTVPANGVFGFTGGEKISSPSDTILSVCDSTNASCLYAYTSSTNKGLAPPNMTTDANGLPFTIHAGNVAANATAARTAGNLVLAGGLDSKPTFAVDANPDTGGHCPGLTQTITSNGVVHNFVYNTYCTAGCTTQAAWCAALKAAVNADSTLGATADCGTITGGATNALLLSATQPATVSLAWSASDACVTTSNGTNGCIQLDKLYMQSRASDGFSLLGTTCGANDGTLYTGSVYAGGFYGNFTATTVVTQNITATDGSQGYKIIEPKGAQSLSTLKQATATFAAGGSATVTLTGLVPLGATRLSVTGRVITAESGGGCTSFSVGDGTIPALYALTVPITLAQTFGPTIASYGPTAGIPTTQLTSAGNVVLTSVGGAGCKNMVVRVTAHYTLDTPDTTN